MSDAEATDRHSLEAQADEVRAQLATTLERLERKRHDLVHLADVPAQIEEHAVPIAAGAAVALVVAGALVSWAVVRVVHAPERRRHERIEALRRAWQHPERVGRQRVGFVSGLVRKVATGLVTTLAMQLAKRALQNPEVLAALPKWERVARDRISAITALASRRRVRVADAASDPFGDPDLDAIARTDMS